MIKSFIKPRPLYVIIDCLLVQAACLLSYIFRFGRFSEGNFRIDLSNFSLYIFLFILWFIFIAFAFKARNLHSTDRSLTIFEEFSRVFAAVGYAGIIMSAVIFFAKYKFFSRQVFVVGFILIIVFLGFFRILKRLILRRLIKKGFRNVNVLIIGSGSSAQKVIEQIKMLPFWGFRVVGFLDVFDSPAIENIKCLGNVKDLETVLRKYFVDEIIIASADDEDIVLRIIKQAKSLHVGVRLMPVLFDEEPFSFSLSYFGIVPLLSYGEKKYHISGLIVKRVLDILGAVTISLLFLPIFIFIAIAIKFDSRGPVFYTRPRIGMKGQVFQFYKFRSMTCDADDKKGSLWDKNEIRDGVIFKIKKDPRVTRVGRFLRRFSLDELPQLFNVIKGDMSLVGPRPFPVEESAKFRHYHMPRLNMRPGITGLPQVRGRSDLLFNQWVRWDLWYIKNWSFALDTRIIIMTIPAVIKGKGAY